MTVIVGRAAALFELKTEGVEQSVAAVKSGILQIQDAAKGLSQTASQVDQTNARILRSFSDLGTRLRAIDPFGSVIGNAARAYEAVVGGSYIPDLVNESIAEIQKLRTAMQNAQTFDPLVADAAVAQEQVSRRLQELKALQASLRFDQGDIGFKNRAEANRFFDREGATRTDRDADALAESVIENADLASALGRLNENASLKAPIEGARELAERYREIDDQLGAINAEIRRLEQSQKAAGKNPLADAYEQAAPALQEAEARIRGVIEAQNELERLNRRMASLSGREERVTNVLETTDDADQLTRNIGLLDRLQQQRRDTQDELAAASARSAEANRALAASLQDVFAAEQRLGNAQQANQGTQRDRSRRTVSELGRGEDAQRGDLFSQQIEGASVAAAAEERLTAAVRQRDTAYVAAGRRAQQTSRQQLDAAQQQQSVVRQVTTSIQQQSVAQDKSTRSQRDSVVAKREILVAQAREAQAAGDLADALELYDSALEQTIDDEKRLAEIQALRNRAQTEQAKLFGAAAVPQDDRTTRTQLEASKQRDAQLKKEADTERKIAQDRQRSADKLINSAARARDYGRAIATVRQELEREVATSVRAQQLRDRESQLRRQQATQIAQAANGLGVFGRQLSSVATQFSAGFVAADLFRRGIQQLNEGFRQLATIDETRRTVGALLDNVDRGNRVFEDANRFGRQYAFTQAEIADALNSLAPLQRTSRLETEKQLEVTARLLSRRPDQGFAGAAFSIQEIAGGDAQSIRDRFNLSLEGANRIKQAVKDGEDVFVAVGEELDRLGVSADVLAQRLEGPAGAMRLLTVSAEDARISLAELFESEMTTGAQWLAALLRNVGLGAEALQQVRSGDFSGITTEQIAMTAGGAQEINNILGFDLIPQEQIAGLIDLARVVTQTSGPLEKLKDAVGTLNNQFGAGRLSVGQFSKELAELSGQASGVDFFNVVKGTENLPDPERIQVLRQNLDSLVQTLTKAKVNPDLARQFTLQAQAVLQEIDKIEGRSPIVVTTEMRVQQMGAITNAITAITQQRQQVDQQLNQFDQNYSDRQSALATQAASTWQNYLDNRARAARDFVQGQARSDRDFAQGQSRAIRDFGREQGRALRDYHRQERRAEEEQARQLAEIRSDLARDLVEIERDTRDKLQDIQGDYDVDVTRDREDYEEKRRKLLAEGEIGRAEELREEFEKDQRRKQEDLLRRRSDVVDEGDTRTSERRQQADEQVRDAQEAAAREREERKRAFEEQRADAQEAFRRQQEDARAAHAQQKADAQAAFAQQQADARQAAEAQLAAISKQQEQERFAYQAGRAAILLGFDEFRLEQERILQLALDNVTRLGELKKEGIEGAEADAIIALENANKEYTRVFGEQQKLFQEGGIKAALQWAGGLGEGLTRSIPLLERVLAEEYGKRMLPRSPIPKGPLKDLAEGGAKAARQYIEGFTTELARLSTDLGLEAIRDSLAVGLGGGGVGRGPAAGGASAARVITIQATIPISGTVMMSGEAVGEIVGEQVVEMVYDDLIGAATVRAARNRPNRQQANARRMD